MSNLSTLFTSILNMSITASYVIIGVLILRFILKKAPKAFSYAIWAVVLFRLLCPFSFNGPISLLGLFNIDGQSHSNILEYIPRDIGYMASPEIQSGLTVLDKGINGSLPDATPYGSVNPMQVWLFLSSWVWLTGVIILLIYSMLSYAKIRKKLATAILVRGNIYETDAFGTAFVCGILNPKIYLPLGVDENHIENILAHEDAHISRGDHLIKPLAFLALTLHWFNPLVWMSFSLMSKDMEMSCDERVLRKIKTVSKEPYSYSLLALSQGLNGIGTVSPLAFGESHVKSRIKNVLHYKKPRFWVTLLALVAVLTASVLLLSNPLRSKPETDDPHSTMAAALMKNKTDYVGDISKVSHLIQVLPLPEGMAYNGTELITKQEPYALIIQVKTEATSSNPTIEKANQKTFQDYSALLLSLIGNVTNIEWRFSDGNSDPFTATYSRENMTSLYRQDLRDFSKNEEILKAFLEKLPTTEVLHSENIALNGIYKLNNKKEIIGTFTPSTDEDFKFIDDVIFDYMIKSAAWPGVDIDSLESYILMRRKGEDYFIFEKDGKTCIQLKKDGYYSILSSELYKAIQNHLN